MIRAVRDLMGEDNLRQRASKLFLLLFFFGLYSPSCKLAFSCCKLFLISGLQAVAEDVSHLW